MDEQTQASERRLALESSHQIPRQLDPFERLAEHELARVQNEGLVIGDREQLGQVRLGDADVDVGIAAVAEDPKAPVEVEVDRGGLEVDRVVRFDPDAPGLQRARDVAVGQDAHLTVAPLSRWAYRLSTSRFRVSRSSKLW